MLISSYVSVYFKQEIKLHTPLDSNQPLYKLPAYLTLPGVHRTWEERVWTVVDGGGRWWTAVVVEGEVTRAQRGNTDVSPTWPAHQIVLSNLI